MTGNGKCSVDQPSARQRPDIDRQAEREAGAISYIAALNDPLLGNCARTTVYRGSREDDGDNPWGDLATRLLEDAQ